MEHITTCYRSPIGDILISATPTGICQLTIAPLQSREHIAYCLPPSSHGLLHEAVKQLTEYFEGTRKNFDLPLHLQGTPFQQRVWQELCQIPFGQTISYAELARRIQQPDAVRAVAAANGRNPVWIVVPCHRVIGTDGSLIGYAGGLWRKEWLLNHEHLNGIHRQLSIF
ncbi:MAG: methylated-DNA--[protein]-cysteine S-methyltransferase [Cytophagales bacterium]|nr:methylated-DNA--[protein]-cysteine S-methyltransferase [Bernardetiaceae bacterium]MDW8205683.1 methylated-DNA--[protein]-cysteine S-methyltransferase [Cytophagales bacterium]